MFFIILALAAVMLPILAPFGNRSVERRLFWTGFVVAPLAMFGFTYPDWKSGIGLALLAIFVMLMNAYFNSSNLKIGGKIYAFNLVDTQPEPCSDDTSTVDCSSEHDPATDSYGGITTAKKYWWLLTFAMFLCTFSAVHTNPSKPWLSPVAVLVVLIVSAGLGYGDATWGYQVARGQRLQFFVVSLITAGVFAVIYLVAYRVGIRRPLRRKQSMEYRAHPHLRKKYP